MKYLAKIDKGQLHSRSMKIRLYKTIVRPIVLYAYGDDLTKYNTTTELTH